MQYSIVDKNGTTAMKVFTYYLDAISKDGGCHLEQQCQHQHPHSSDTTSV